MKNDDNKLTLTYLIVLTLYAKTEMSANDSDSKHNLPCL